MHLWYVRWRHWSDKACVEKRKNITQIIEVKEATKFCILMDSNMYLMKCCKITIRLKIFGITISWLSYKGTIFSYTSRVPSSGGLYKNHSVCLSVRQSVCPSVCADSCPANNFFFGLTLAYHIWYIGLSPLDDVSRIFIVPIWPWPLTFDVSRTFMIFVWPWPLTSI